MAVDSDFDTGDAEPATNGAKLAPCGAKVAGAVAPRRLGGVVNRRGLRVPECGHLGNKLSHLD